MDRYDAFVQTIGKLTTLLNLQIDRLRQKIYQDWLSLNRCIFHRRSSGFGSAQLFFDDITAWQGLPTAGRHGKLFPTDRALCFAVWLQASAVSFDTTEAEGVGARQANRLLENFGAYAALSDVGYLVLETVTRSHERRILKADTTLHTLK